MSVATGDGVAVSASIRIGTGVFVAVGVDVLDGVGVESGSRNGVLVGSGKRNGVLVATNVAVGVTTASAVSVVAAIAGMGGADAAGEHAATMICTKAIVINMTVALCPIIDRRCITVGRLFSR